MRGVTICWDSYLSSYGFKVGLKQRACNWPSVRHEEGIILRGDGGTVIDIMNESRIVRRRRVGEFEG